MAFFPASFVAVVCLLASFALADPALPPAGNIASFRTKGRGQRLFVCNATSKSWTMDTSWGDLFYYSDKNYTRRIGIHYQLQFPDANGGRQSWLISKHPGLADFVAPSFTITGKVIEITLEPGQLEAVLLQATSFSGHTTMSYIKEVPVRGGLPPSPDLCTKTGDNLRVDFESDYIFFSQLRQSPASIFSNKTSNTSSLLGSYFAEGHQRYTFDNSSWKLTGALASLSSLPGREVVGKHFFRHEADENGGKPTWVIQSPCRSVVTAKVVETVSSKDNYSAPLLRLERTSSDGQTQGIASATRIERLSTRGGLPRSSPGKNGEIHDSPYTAIYWFYT